MTGNTGLRHLSRRPVRKRTFAVRRHCVAADGTFFRTDGYEETRVVKFDKTGKFLMAWGERARQAQ